MAGMAEKQADLETWRDRPLKAQEGTEENGQSNAQQIAGSCGRRSVTLYIFKLRVGD